MGNLILLVEDNEDDVFIMQKAIKRAGIANPVRVVEDGQKALDYVEGRGEFADRARYPLPSLILLDLKLPEVHGFDVLKAIRANGALPHLLVIVLTSSDQGSDIERAYRTGANSYLVKPPMPQQLDAMVRTFSEYWLQWNRQPPGKL